MESMTGLATCRLAIAEADLTSHHVLQTVLAFGTAFRVSDYARHRVGYLFTYPRLSTSPFAPQLCIAHTPHRHKEITK